MPAPDGNIGEKRETVSDRPGRGTIAFIFIATALLLILANIPLIYGYLIQPPHLKFMGIVAGPRDSNIYFMMMAQGDGGSPILENLFRPGEPNEIYHGFFWFVLGKAAHLLGFSTLAAYHFARVLAIIAFVPAICAFTRRFLRSRLERLSAAGIICFGAGAGWIMVIIYYLSGYMPFHPSDIGTPEASAFFTLMTFPHLSFTLILVFLCMMYVWDAVDSGRMKPACAAGLCAIVVGFIHAFNLVVLCFALGLFLAGTLLIKRDRSPVGAIIVVACFAVWPLAYYTFITLAKPGLLPVGAVRSPTPLAYLVGFGPTVIAVVIRIIFLRRRRELPPSDLFLFCWIAATGVLLYSYPLLTQEARAVLGLQLPLAILAVRAVFWDILPALGADFGEEGRKRPNTRAVVIVSLFIGITLPSTFYNIADRSLRLRNLPELFCLTEDEHEALEYLRGVDDGKVVLSGDRIGLYVPRLTGKPTWMGQYNYPSYNRRMDEIRKFFSESTTDSARFAFLRENDIGFVFHGEQEESFGGFRPGDADYLEKVFENATVSVYATADASGGRSKAFGVDSHGDV